MHLPERLHQHVDLGDARARKPGWGTGGNGPGGRGDAVQRLRDRARGEERQHRADQQREERRPRHLALCAADEGIHLGQVRRHPDDAGTAGHGDVHQLAADRLAPARGHARPAREREADLGPARMVLDRGKRARREVAVHPHAAGPVDEGEAMAVGGGEPVHCQVPAERIDRKGLADELGLALEPAGDVALEVPPERPLGAPEEDQDREDEDDDRAQHQPSGQAHLARAPRSVPRNR